MYICESEYDWKHAQEKANNIISWLSTNWKQLSMHLRYVFLLWCCHHSPATMVRHVSESKRKVNTCAIYTTIDSNDRLQSEMVFFLQLFKCFLRLSDALSSLHDFCCCCVFHMKDKNRTKQLMSSVWRWYLINDYNVREFAHNRPNIFNNGIYFLPQINGSQNFVYKKRNNCW